MPQNRIPSGLSFPHRGQRTKFPQPIAYDILNFLCRRGAFFVSMTASEYSRALTNVVVQGHRLEVVRIGASDPTKPELVFLHEGLGSISHWRKFPWQVGEATGCAVTVYSRYGNGDSEILSEPRSVRYMHEEALSVLPDLLGQLNIENPVLVGHSDGASIALIYAGANPSAALGKTGVRGLVLLAPHVFVEELSVTSIAEAKVLFQTTDLAQRLANHHRDAARTFWGWNDIWLHPDFRSWNIEEYLPSINCPVLVIQGLDDQYGTMAQVEAIQRQAGGSVEVLALSNCKHSPQRDQREATLQAIVNFVSRLHA